MVHLVSYHQKASADECWRQAGIARPVVLVRDSNDAVLANETAGSRGIYCMKTHKETRKTMQGWAEREVRAVIGLGGRPSCTLEEVERYQPKGPIAWFGYMIADVLSLVTLRRMSKTWRVRPPYPHWCQHAPAIRRWVDELAIASRLPSNTTLAHGFVSMRRYFARSRCRYRIPCCGIR